MISRIGQRTIFLYRSIYLTKTINYLSQIQKGDYQMTLLDFFLAAQTELTLVKNKY